ncbi:hypothetical protein H4R33_003675 [Dimargaris cristalligena]|nr:hypothetical protein H4R33_003675 [Dimargaris cristalligena]
MMHPIAYSRKCTFPVALLLWLALSSPGSLIQANPVSVANSGDIMHQVSDWADYPLLQEEPGSTDWASSSGTPSVISYGDKRAQFPDSNIPSDIGGEGGEGEYLSDWEIENSVDGSDALSQAGVMTSHSSVEDPLPESQTSLVVEGDVHSGTSKSTCSKTNQKSWNEVKKSNPSSYSMAVKGKLPTPTFDKVAERASFPNVENPRPKVENSAWAKPKHPVSAPKLKLGESDWPELGKQLLPSTINTDRVKLTNTPAPISASPASTSGPKQNDEHAWSKLVKQPPAPVAKAAQGKSVSPPSVPESGVNGQAIGRPVQFTNDPPTRIIPPWAQLPGETEFLALRLGDLLLWDGVYSRQVYFYRDTEAYFNHIVRIFEFLRRGKVSPEQMMEQINQVLRYLLQTGTYLHSEAKRSSKLELQWYDSCDPQFFLLFEQMLYPRSQAPAATDLVEQQNTILEHMNRDFVARHSSRTSMLLRAHLLRYRIRIFGQGVLKLMTSFDEYLKIFFDRITKKERAIYLTFHLPGYKHRGRLLVELAQKWTRYYPMNGLLNSFTMTLYIQNHLEVHQEFEDILFLGDAESIPSKD